MYRKNLFAIIMAALILLTACTAASPESAATPGDVPQTRAATNPAPSISPSATVQSVASEPAMDPSLACSGGKTSADATIQLTEGPYYTPNTPERSSLYEDGMPGTKLTITGYVYDMDCQPVANAWLDFWQADAEGNYDNSGYTLRGHQYTDSNGRFELVTVVPGIYPGRTEHIHFKVQAPNGQAITSQLFFPGVAENETDRIFDPSLLLPIQEGGEDLLGQYNFIVPAQ